MTSRERILTAYEHRETDRIPVDFGGHRSSGIMLPAYRNLRRKLGLGETPGYLYDVIQQLVYVESDVLDCCRADVEDMGSLAIGKPDFWKPWTMQDGTECRIPAYIEIGETPDGNVLYDSRGNPIAIQKRGQLFFEQTNFPLLDSAFDPSAELAGYLDGIMWSRIATPPGPVEYDDEGLAFLADWSREFRDKEDRAIYGTFGGNLIETGEFAYRMDNFLFKMAAEPGEIHGFLDKLTQLHLDNLDKYLSAVGDNIDIIGFGDDLGMQTGPQISPAMYREFFKERHKAIWGRAKQLKPGLKMCLHSCGDIRMLLPDMIEAGLESVNPVQYTCPGMDLKELKAEFGRDLVFWGGGCDTQRILPHGTPLEVKDEVKRNIDILRKDGGFVFQQVHNMIGDIPSENIIGMYDAVNEA